MHRRRRAVLPGISHDRWAEARGGRLTLRRARCFAELAVERLPEHRAAPREGEHPFPVDPGWVVPHVLSMTAVELCHPVAFLIPVIADDLSQHVGLDTHAGRCRRCNGALAVSPAVAKGGGNGIDG